MRRRGTAEEMPWPLAGVSEGPDLLPREAVFGLHGERGGPLRAADFERWEQTEESPLELIEGWVLSMTPGTHPTGKALIELISVLAPVVRAKGWTMSLDARHRLPRPLETVVFPDLAIHCAGEVSFVPGSETVSRVPDLVIELLGRETAQRDRAPHGAKFLTYQICGVQEYYYAWPDGRGAAGFHLHDGRFAPAPRDEEGFYHSPLLGMALRLCPADLRAPSPSP